MIFTKDSIIRLIYTVLVSGFICLFSTIIFFEYGIKVDAIFISIGVGSFIWLVSEVITNVISKKWPHNIFPAFVALFVLIALGTALGTIVLGIESWIIILLICLSAEVFGISIAVIYHIYYKKLLNKQLKEFIKKN